LEELHLTGNPLAEVPAAFGCLKSLEVLDLSCCNITKLPGEFTYMMKMMELNLATNELQELPQSFGRMTRLVMLNVSDNHLTDLPLSMGYCIGLNKFGAGINLERNPIKDQEMTKKYKIGPDHLCDYLEKRMTLHGEPKLEEYDLPFQDVDEKSNSKSSDGPMWGKKRGEVMEQQHPKPVQPAPQPIPPKVLLDEKLVALKKWGNVTIQSELRGKIASIQGKVDSSVETNDVVSVALIVKKLKPDVEKARSLIPPFVTPTVELASSVDKVAQLRAAIASAVQ